MEALEVLGDLLEDLGYLVGVVVVEGPRDVEALRLLGFEGRVDVCSRVKVSDADLVESFVQDGVPVVILTDFDEEGRRLNRDLTRILERRGVKVEVGLRRRFGRLMAALGVYAIEDLDDVVFLGLKAVMKGLPPLLLVKGDKGFVMCGYLNIDVAERLGAAAAVVSGVSSFDDVLNAEIRSATTKAKALGLEPGKVVRNVIGALA
jgi:uncharacterized protein YunC (DUF1805 family)